MKMEKPQLNYDTGIATGRPSLNFVLNVDKCGHVTHLAERRWTRRRLQCSTGQDHWAKSRGAARAAQSSEPWVIVVMQNLGTQCFYSQTSLNIDWIPLVLGGQSDQWMEQQWQQQQASSQRRFEHKCWMNHILKLFVHYILQNTQKTIEYLFFRV